MSEGKSEVGRIVKAEDARRRVLDADGAPVFSRAGWARALKRGDIPNLMINGRRFVSLIALVAMFGGGG